MERLLVTGVDYPLGSNLALALADRWHVLGLYSQIAVESSDVQTAHCVADDRIAIDAFVEDWQPQWILHCGPLSANSWDCDDEIASIGCAPEAAGHWADAAKSVSARLTVLSSDIVFAGPRIFHEESSPAANPSGTAAAVRAMERALECSDAMIVRTHAYGWSPVCGHAGFVQRLLEAIRSGRSLSADGRRHATPILATDLAELLLRAYELRLNGIYHLAGAERTSPFRFAGELAAAIGLTLPADRLLPLEEAGRDGYSETSLNSKRARRMLATATPMLREGLSRFAEQADNGWRARMHGTRRIASPQDVAA